MQNAKNEVRKSRRDQMVERMQTKYPDKGFDDDEALFGQISDDYDQYDQDLNRYKEREDQLSDMFTSDPRSAAFLMSWRDGGDPAIELVRMFGTEIKEAIDDPDRQEEIAKANKEFVEKVAKEKELEGQYQQNLNASLQAVEQYQQAHGLTDDQVDQAMTWLVGIVSDGVMGKFSEEAIDLAMKGISHDSDVAVANREGEVRGRNSKIEERLRRGSAGDGTPSLAGRNGEAGGRQATNNIFDLAQEAR